MAKHVHKILTIVGARPQFIKAAALSRAIQKSEGLEEVLIHTGQHYDSSLSSDFFKELDIPDPKYNLGVGSKSHNNQMAEIIKGLDEIFEQESPDLVVVYGDTNSTSAGAIAAAKRNLPIAHVEAGLREWDKSIPEEVNKLITDALADLFFSPTQTGVDNLKKCGIVDGVYLTGDISLDLLFSDTNYIEKERLIKTYSIDQPYLLFTCHRASNTNNPQNFINILNAIEKFGMPTIFLMHPRTENMIDVQNIDLPECIDKLSPQGFWATQSLIKNAEAVITDSGGIIKEAYFHKVPGIIIDKQTEWVETIEEGWNKVCGPDSQKIYEALIQIHRPAIHTQALGDGRAGQRIVRHIMDYLNK